MTLDEKLEQFYHAAIESATNQNIQIVEEYKKSLQEIYEEYQKEAERKAEAIYRGESEKLLREKNRTLSSEAIKLKRKLNDKSEEITEKLFLEVSEQLKAFMSTSDYFSLLCSQIKKAVDYADGEDMTIYINPTDEGLKASLEEKTKTSLTISNRDFIGGTRAVIHNRNILIDNSFLTKLEELKSSFQFPVDSIYGKENLHL